MTKQFWMRIKSAHQSPMNPKQWLIVLSCGHEYWQTRMRRPKIGAKFFCRECLNVIQGGSKLMEGV